MHALLRQPLNGAFRFFFQRLKEIIKNHDSNVEIHEKEGDKKGISKLVQWIHSDGACQFLMLQITNKGNLCFYSRENKVEMLL